MSLTARPIGHAPGRRFRSEDCRPLGAWTIPSVTAAHDLRYKDFADEADFPES
jgi:hypothetical protein